MKIKQISRTFKNDLKKIITEIEKQTSVEVALAITPQSDNYTDTHLRCALFFSIPLMLFMVFSPWVFSEIQAVAILVLSFTAGFLLPKASPTVKRWLVSKKRKSHYVKRAASTYFLDNNLCNTLERTGFLVYISILEKKCVLLGDRGIKEAVPDGDWRNLEADFETIFSNGDLLRNILDILPGVTGIFATYLPPGESNPDELSNEMGEDL